MSRGNDDYPLIRNPQSSVPGPVRSFALQILPTLPPNIPLLYGVLGTGTPPWKMSKSDSSYTDQSQMPSQRCSNCRHSYEHVTSERFICDQIRGEIVPRGWCRLWKPPQG